MFILKGGKLKENKVNPPEDMPPSFDEHKKSHFYGELTMPGYAVGNPHDRLQCAFMLAAADSMNHLDFNVHDFAAPCLAPETGC